ncbi:hypothetical protein F2Q68_00039097 [Brassica cretica]|uniref:Uncharacterized protein n=1 Tax=Brassica cretica TaxID=69181 RepID=A0A8S9MLF2_BRACR|nr:hypothetical protein F2Q68_00039097 [Brassica cretica]
MGVRNDMAARLDPRWIGRYVATKPLGRSLRSARLVRGPVTTWRPCLDPLLFTFYERVLGLWVFSFDGSTKNSARFHRKVVLTDRTQIEHRPVWIMDTAQGVISRPTQQVKTDGRAIIHFVRAGRSVTYLNELSELSDTSLELSDTEDGAE